MYNCRSFKDVDIVLQDRRIYKFYNEIQDTYFTDPHENHFFSLTWSNGHTLKDYIDVIPRHITTYKEIIELKKRKREYKKIIPELIYMERKMCFDVMNVIKGFMI